MQALLFLLAFLLVQASVFGQGPSVDTVYLVDGIDGYEQVGDLIVAPKGSKPILRPAGVLEFEHSPDANVVVLASDQKRNPIEVRRNGNRFLVLGVGKIWIDLTIVDFEKRIFDQRQFSIAIDGESPSPDPDPDPPPEPDAPDDVPADEFDNLAQRIAKATAGLPSRQSVAAIYKSAAKNLLNDPSASIDSVGSVLRAKLTAIAEWEKFDRFRKLVNKDLSDRWPESGMLKRTLARYYQVIALGLEAGK